VYTVSLLFSSKVDNEPGFWEETIVAVQGDSSENAVLRGEELGRRDLPAYPNAEGHLVTWSFVKCVHVSMNNLKCEEGTEVFARFITRELAETMMAEEMRFIESFAC
jgi:hypothetical protein